MPGGGVASADISVSLHNRVYRYTPCVGLKKKKRSTNDPQSQVSHSIRGTNTSIQSINGVATPIFWCHTKWVKCVNKIAGIGPMIYPLLVSIMILDE